MLPLLQNFLVDRFESLVYLNLSMDFSRNHRMIRAVNAIVLAKGFREIFWGLFA